MLRKGTVPTNIYLRRLHNFCFDIDNSFSLNMFQSFCCPRLRSFADELNS
jgi:hypothetical protein